MINRTMLRLWTASVQSVSESQQVCGQDACGQERGASLVEYALLVALISLVVVGAVSVLGSATTEPYSQLGSQLAS